MQLDLLSASAKHVEADAISQFPSMMAAAPIRAHVKDSIAHWQSSTGKVLSEAFPFCKHEDEFFSWQAGNRLRPLASDDFNLAIDAYADFCKVTRVPVNDAFWRRQIDQDDRPVSVRLFLETWQKQLDRLRADWEMQEIAIRRDALMAALREQLAMLHTLHDTLSALGFDTGLLLDFSQGTLSAQDIARLERWASYLSDDPGMKALCEILGKIRQIAWADRIERVKSVAQIATAIPDIYSSEEIVGIKLGRDIERLLPSELALLGDPDTAVLFDLKYIESSLMCFDMHGMQNIANDVEIEEDRHVQDADQQGPMIVCIDTSGSMQGMPETIAKAVALFLAMKAREEKRACYLINFSTSIVTLDLSGHTGIAELLGFLKMSFNGGTDAAPALDHALSKMEEDAYKNADLVIASDFVMSTLPEATRLCIDRRRADGNKFHSLVVGECYMTHRLKGVFDNEWIVDPRSGAVHALIDFERSVRATPVPHR